MTRREIILRPWMLLFAPFVYVERPAPMKRKKPGDFLRADDWNDLVDAINSLRTSDIKRV